MMVEMYIILSADRSFFSVVQRVDIVSCIRGVVSYSFQ